MKSAAVLLLVVLTFGCTKQDPTFEKTLKDHLQRHPKMEIQDVYKLVYQAAMGNEHLMTDTSAVRRYLMDELNSVDTSTTEPMAETISPDGELIRLNLRPYKAARGDVQDLYYAVSATSRWFQKSEKRLQRWWEEIEELGAKHKIPFERDSLRGYFVRIKSEHFPPVHHSASYTQAYRPAYRVVEKNLIMIRAFVFYRDQK
jgi:hypothetical protein